MSFIDILRTARSSPVATLHKFKTNYDPTSRRVYAFVEGEPDRVFYHHHISVILKDTTEVFVYNCEGKARVFDAFRNIIADYPDCRRVLFFVDKDVDDFVGVSWPNDPRIFVTEHYSVESYIIGSTSCRSYFRDFVKVRRVEIDIERFSLEFENTRKQFHGMMLAIMAWIIAFRRRGGEIVLRDLQLDKLFQFDGTYVRRRPDRSAHAYLRRFATNGTTAPSWHDVLAVVRQLKSVDPRSYIRGHFDAWCFIKAIQRMADDLQKIVTEAQGSVSFCSPLAESNYIQLLCRTVDCPKRVASFLRFHLAEPRSVEPTRRTTPWWRFGWWAKRG